MAGRGCEGLCGPPDARLRGQLEGFVRGEERRNARDGREEPPPPTPAGSAETTVINCCPMTGRGSGSRANGPSGMVSHRPV